MVRAWRGAACATRPAAPSAQRPAALTCVSRKFNGDTESVEILATRRARDETPRASPRPADPPASAAARIPRLEVDHVAGIEATGGLARVFVRVQNVQAEEFNIYVEVSDNCTLNWVWVTWVATDAV